MKGVLHVFKAVTKSWFRSKSGVFFSFLFPLMLLLIFGTVFGGVQDSSYGIYVQNRDIEGGQPTPLSRALENALRTVNALDVENVPPGADLNEYVEKSSSFSKSRVLVIPENFDRRVRTRSTRVGIGVTLTTLSRLMDYGGPSIPENDRSQIKEGMSELENMKGAVPSENVNLKLFTTEGDQSAPIVRSIVHSVVGSFNERSIGARPVVSVEEGSLRRRDLGVISYYLPGLIAAFIMVNGIIGVTSNISEFNRNGIIKRLAATSLDKKSWIIGNILNQAVLAFMLTFVMIGASWVFFGVGIIPGAYSIALIFLGSTVFSSVGITLGGVIKDIEGANAAGNAIGFPMMFLSGSFWPLETMPDFMQTLAKALPLYYLHDGLREIMIYKQPGQASMPFLLYGVLTVVLVAVAVKVTKWKEF
ncbi:hypothetical protein AKJ37_07845 [candidate division MSBL1 archaeon SCGC-AAA259I09]|uniref:ABC transmembrane type-2 domain-containing protein n=1 Tax=candidate division MSBL1 archaeon SCGC-AAA259I09 TaxID=1698267 RepID=A0A133UJ20_9EURY|nr:hypothetical protein AKJ37_07845 [candidate division MSBL1 archaeon SCGC-AAA259I09]